MQIKIKAYSKADGTWVKAHRRVNTSIDLKKLVRKPPTSVRLKVLANKLQSPWRVNYSDRISERIKFVKSRMNKLKIDWYR